MKTHEWANSLGAFINVEASGSGGLGIIRLNLDQSCNVDSCLHATSVITKWFCRVLKY